MNRKSGIYRGTVRHSRKTPRPHSFEYSLYMLFLDLQELPELFHGRWFWSHERSNLFSFRRRDYLGPEDVPLDTAVRDLVETRLGARPDGPIRMLTQLRSFGFAFNPVTIYYCFDPADNVEAIVAEITNTPWGERHRYVVRGTGRSEFAKEFHISPFMAMDQDYTWEFSAPSDSLAIRMQNHEHGETVLDVSMHLSRRPWSAAELARTTLRHPAMTTKILAGIYWQAFRLWLKRTPFHEHPALLTKDAS